MQRAAITSVEPLPGCAIEAVQPLQIEREADGRIDRGQRLCGHARDQLGAVRGRIDEGLIAHRLYGIESRIDLGGVRWDVRATNHV